MSACNTNGNSKITPMTEMYNLKNVFYETLNPYKVGKGITGLSAHANRQGNMLFDYANPLTKDYHGSISGTPKYQNTQESRPQSLDSRINGIDYSKAANLKSKDSRYSSLDESEKVKEMYKDFEKSKVGKQLDSFMKNKGYSKKSIDDYLVADLGKNSVAAVIKSPQRTALAAGKDYLESLEQDPIKRMYTLAHETVHIHGVMSEKQTDNYLKEFFTHMAEQSEDINEKQVYNALTAYAGQRVRHEEKKESSGHENIAPKQSYSSLAAGNQSSYRNAA